MNTRFSESIVEDAALAWLDALGYGSDIAAGEPGAERSGPNYRDVLLERRLRQALVRLNPDLPRDALDDAYRKLTRVDVQSVVERNRGCALNARGGTAVQCRRRDGSIAGFVSCGEMLADIYNCLQFGTCHRPSTGSVH